MTKMEKMIEGLVDSQNKLLTNQTEFSDSLRSLNDRVELLTTKTRLLETQVAQQAASSSRTQGQLPGKPENNPREQAHAITLRSGTKYDEPTMPTNDTPKQQEDPIPTAEKEPITTISISAKFNIPLGIFDDGLLVLLSSKLKVPNVMVLDRTISILPIFFKSCSRCLDCRIFSIATVFL